MNRKYFDTEQTAPPVTPFGIFTDQAGCFPDSVKKVYIPFEYDSFELTDNAGNICFSGNTLKREFSGIHSCRRSASPICFG